MSAGISFNQNEHDVVTLEFPCGDKIKEYSIFYSIFYDEKQSQSPGRTLINGSSAVKEGFMSFLHEILLPLNSPENSGFHNKNQVFSFSY